MDGTKFACSSKDRGPEPMCILSDECKVGVPVQDRVMMRHPKTWGLLLHFCGKYNYSMYVQRFLFCRTKMEKWHDIKPHFDGSSSTN